jgi:molecular chaperone GrpE (heat shock protein)
MADEVKEDTNNEKNLVIKQDLEDIPNSVSWTEDQQYRTAEILSSLKENATLLNDIKVTIQNRLEYDSVKEKAIDKINDELKFYKDGFIFQSQKSIYIDLMLFYDSIERIIDSIINGNTFTKENIIGQIELLKEELLEIFYRRDITPYDEHPEVLNYKLHKTVKTVPTDLETENNKIYKIIKIGFRLKDNIIRPEEVIIKKYDKTREDRQ